jgi:hypothetical protein
LKNIQKILDSKKSADKRSRNSVPKKSGNGRFSKEHLRDLRNKIRIRGLIENELGVRNHAESGIFRFECPLCGSFHTSVMKTKNLARCFECEVNFNPIDIVMETKKTDFLQSADFLTNLLESGMPGNPAAPEIRDDSGLVSPCSPAEPPEWTADGRIQSLEKEIGELNNRMDRLQRLLVGLLSKRGDLRETLGKMDR